MAFNYNGRGLPKLSNYVQARDFFEAAKTWRGDPEGAERKLDGSKRHTGIRRLHDDSIACRLYHTDVITYHPDDTITVRPYESRTTDKFFNQLVSDIWGLQSSFTSGVIQVGGRFYRAIDTLQIDLAATEMQMLTETEPFKFWTIDRKRAKAARDLYGYGDFSAYANMSEKMHVTVVPRAERQWFHTPEERLTALKDRALWPHLLEGQSGAMYNDVVIDAARTLVDRETIYRVHPEVYDTTEKPYLESWAEVERWKRQ